MRDALDIPGSSGRRRCAEDFEQHGVESRVDTGGRPMSGEVGGHVGMQRLFWASPDRAGHFLAAGSSWQMQSHSGFLQAPQGAVS